MNTLKKEREQKLPEDNYPWLDPDDDRRYMTDREILEKYVNLNNSCISLPISQRHIFSTRKFQMQGIVSIGSERCLSLIKPVRKFKEVLQYTPIFW